MIPPTNNQPPATIIFWVIWFAILSGLVTIQMVVGGGIPTGKDLGNPQPVFYIITAVMAAVALGIGTLVIPALGSLAKKLPAMIVGLAVSEGIGTIGAVAVSSELGQTRLVMFATAICCILAFAPYYAKGDDLHGRPRP